MTQWAHELDLLTDRVIWCIINVHQALGSGFLESIYRRAMIVELKGTGLSAEIEREVRIHYKGHEVGKHRLDLLVEKQLIVELKTVELLGKAHYAQVRSYLKATGLQRALLVNFAADRADFRRIESHDLHA